MQRKVRATQSIVSGNARQAAMFGQWNSDDGISQLSDDETATLRVASSSKPTLQGLLAQVGG